MAMVGSFKLIFDQHPAIGVDVLAEDVSTKRTDRLFLRFQFKVDAKRLTQHRDILGPRKPRREFSSFADPDIAKVNAFEASQLLVRHAQASEGSPFPM